MQTLCTPAETAPCRSPIQVGAACASYHNVTNTIFHAALRAELLTPTRSTEPRAIAMLIICVPQARAMGTDLSGTGCVGGPAAASAAPQSPAWGRRAPQNSVSDALPAIA